MRRGAREHPDRPLRQRCRLRPELRNPIRHRVRLQPIGNGDHFLSGQILDWQRARHAVEKNGIGTNVKPQGVV